MAQAPRFWPDLTGYTCDGTGATPPGFPTELTRRRNQRWRRDLLGYLRSGGAVILNRPDTGLDHASLAALERGPVLAQSGPWVLRSVRR